MFARHGRIVMALALSAGAMAVGTGSIDGCAGASRQPRDAARGGESRGTGGLSLVARPRAGVEQLALYGSPDAAQPRTTIARTGPYGTERTFLVKRRAGGWVQIYLPTRPNGSTAWASARQLRLSQIDTRVVVDTKRFTLRVLRDNSLIRRIRIGLGTASRPTPKGLFYLTELLRPPDPSGPYGAYAFGLSGHSNAVRSFAGGDGQLGIHGTNQPELIGRAISNGCVRLTNGDITFLARTLPLGTPVEIT